MEDINLLQLNGVKGTDKVIGEGAYGRVIEVSMLCAAKEIHHILVGSSRPQAVAVLKQKFLQECLHCSQLCHPNIVQFLGIHYPSEDAKLPWLVMEKLEFSLTQYLENHKPTKVSFQVRMSILHDISLGLQYLHVQDIIHRDLSSNNILLTKQLVAKIGDLGVAKAVDPNHMKSATQAPGTVVFMPPEALLVKPKYDKSVDVFSFGCVMMHVMTHIWPIPKDEMYVDETTGKKVPRSEIERREDYLEAIHEPVKLKELILQCLQDLSKRRPSVSDISRIFRQIQPDLKLTTVQSIVLDHDLMQSQVITLEAKVKELRDELAIERKATEAAVSHLDDTVGKLQQVRNEKCILDQQMTTSNKEREDRIAELEEFINGQVTELDKMEAALKQAIASKEEVEEDYKKLDADYKSAKEIYEQRYINHEEELQSKEFLINTYKEDFEQERKDRENAHNIKEDEIKKMRIEMQKFEAECQGKVQNVKRALEDQVVKYKEQATHYSVECNKISKEYEKLHREYNAEFTKLSKERDRVQAELEKEKKEAQGKLDVYKRNTEQFQVQWRKREESEAQVKMITEQLNHQIELNKQQQTTINDLMRMHKNIEPQIPTNIGGHQAYDYQQQSQQHRHDTLSTRTNAEAPYQHPSPPPSQQRYQGQGRGGMPQNTARPAQPGYQSKYLPPSNFDSQPQSMREYNTSGTNAAVQQDRYYVDEPHREHYGQGRHNTGPVLLDSYKARQIAAGYNNANFPQQPQPPSVRSERPPHGQAEHYVSEGINEEIRHQADFQCQQNQQDLDFTSHLSLDPFLICPKCRRQFREGQLPEYRRHIDNCRL